MEGKHLGGKLAVQILPMLWLKGLYVWAVWICYLTNTFCVLLEKSTRIHLKIPKPVPCCFTQKKRELEAKANLFPRSRSWISEDFPDVKSLILYELGVVVVELSRPEVDGKGTFVSLKCEA